MARPLKPDPTVVFVKTYGHGPAEQVEEGLLAIVRGAREGCARRQATQVENSRPAEGHDAAAPAKAA